MAAGLWPTAAAVALGGGGGYRDATIGEPAVPPLGVKGERNEEREVEKATPGTPASCANTAGAEMTSPPIAGTPLLGVPAGAPGPEEAPQHLEPEALVPNPAAALAAAGATAATEVQARGVPRMLSLMVGSQDSPPPPLAPPPVAQGDGPGGAAPGGMAATEAVRSPGGAKRTATQSVLVMPGQVPGFKRMRPAWAR